MLEPVEDEILFGWKNERTKIEEKKYLYKKLFDTKN